MFDWSIGMNLIGKDVSASKALMNLGKNAKNMERNFEALNRKATWAMAGITAAAVASVRAAAQDEAAQVQLAQTLKNVMGATKAQTVETEKYISSLSFTAAKADDELRPAYDRLIRSTSSYTKAQRLLNLAINISYSKNKPLVEVTNALAKANDGNMGALKRIGVKVDAASKSQKIYGTVMKIVNGQLVATQVQIGKTAKGVVTLDSQLGKLEKQYKDGLNVATETASFKLMQFEIGVKELKESIGYALLPELNKWIKKLPDLLAYLERNKTNIINIGKATLAFAIAIKSINAALKIFKAIQASIKFAQFIANWYRLGGAATTAGGQIAAAGTVASAGWAPFFAGMAEAAIVLGLVALAAKGVKDNWNKARPNAKGKVATGAENFQSYSATGGTSFSYMYGNQKILGHAKGGIVTKPHIGLVGEAGPEAIIPLNKAHGFGGVTIINNIRGSVITEKELALRVRNDMAQLLRRKGLDVSVLGV